MKYSIIAIGDELLIGQVTDTNSGWIARHMTPRGWDVNTVQVVPDDAEQIKLAIEEIFDVKVEKVNTANVHGKLKRQGKYEGYTPDYKKAIVKLKADSKSIAFFDSLS